MVWWTVRVERTRHNAMVSHVLVIYAAPTLQPVFLRMKCAMVNRTADKRTTSAFASDAQMVVSAGETLCLVVTSRDWISRFILMFFSLMTLIWLLFT